MSEAGGAPPSAAHPSTNSDISAAVGADVHRLVIIEDHRQLQTALVCLFSSHADFEVIASGAGLPDVHAAIVEEHPDLVILGIGRGNGQGLEAITSLLQRDRPPAVLVFSSQGGHSVAERFLQAGARGYVDKGSDPRQLVDAARAVLAGATCITDRESGRLRRGTVRPVS
jgi:DNA-binding NarL/FixJ family response regulator